MPLHTQTPFQVRASRPALDTGHRGFASHGCRRTRRNHTIAQAISLATRLGQGSGVMIDTYNTWWDPALKDSIANARGQIAGYQLLYWLLPTTDMAFDRGMPGEGVIDLPAIRTMVRQAVTASFMQIC